MAAPARPTDPVDESKTFYDQWLAVLGYGKEVPVFWISAFTDLGPNREVHLAFSAADAVTVRAAHAAATGMGAESLHESRLWPEYHPGYYAAFVRDPDGNNVEAVCHSGADD